MKRGLLTPHEVQLCVDAGFRGRLIGHSRDGLEFYRVCCRGDFEGSIPRSTVNFSVVEGCWLPASTIWTIRPSGTFLIWIGGYPRLAALDLREPPPGQGSGKVLTVRRDGVDTMMGWRPIVPPRRGK